MTGFKTIPPYYLYLRLFYFFIKFFACSTHTKKVTLGVKETGRFYYINSLPESETGLWYKNSNNLLKTLDEIENLYAVLLKCSERKL